MNDIKYYECHVTVEPVFDEHLELFKILCAKFDFRVADLLMQRRKEDLPTRSSKDSFCTARSKNYDSILFKMNNLVLELQDNGFQVWRKKIEAVVLDERLKQDL